jgi:hypothetical protein
MSAMNSASTALAGFGVGASASRSRTVGRGSCRRRGRGLGSAGQREQGPRDHQHEAAVGLEAADRLGGDLELVLVAGVVDGVDQRAVGVAGQDAPHVREGLAVHGATSGCAVSIL